MKPYAFAMLVVASLLAACGGAAQPPAGGRVAPASPPFSGAAVLTYKQTATSNGPVWGFTCISPQIGGATTESASAIITETVAADQKSAASDVQLQNCADGTEPVDEVDHFLPPALTGATMTFSPRFLAPYTDTLAYDSGISLGSNSSPARTFTTANETLRVNADGSYTDTVSGANTQAFPYYSLTTVENADASGVQTLAAGISPSPPPYVVAHSAPSNHIVIVSTSGTPPVPPDWPTPTPCPTAGGTPCPLAPSPTPYPQYAWYPYVPSSQAPFETITSTDKGTAALPPACEVPSVFPQEAEVIETVDAALDIWTGTASAVSDAYVDPHYGVLCLEVTLTQASYSLGPTSADTAPTGTRTLTFVDSLQSESAPPGIAALPAPGRYLIFWR